MDENILKTKNLFFVKALISGLIFLGLGFILLKPYSLVKKELSLSYLKAHLKVDPQKIRDKAMLEALSARIPSFTHLRNVILQKEEVSLVMFKEYVSYYEKVIEVFPAAADVYGILGYCYYQIGEQKKAVDMLSKSIVIDPDMFWSKYNLGLIFFKKGEFSKASYLLEQSLQTSFEKNASILSSSIAYRQILGNILSPPEFVSRLLKLNENTRFLYLLSLYQLRDFKKMYVIAKNFQEINVLDSDKISCYQGLALLELKVFEKSYSNFRNCSKDPVFHYDALRYVLINQRVLGLEDNDGVLWRARKNWKGSKETILSFGDRTSLAIF